MTDHQERVEHPEAQILKHRAVKGGIWVMLSAYWTLAFGFIANIFLTRILAAEDFGAFSLAMFFAQLFRVQIRLGLGKAYAQHPDSNETTVGTFLGLESLGSLLSIALGGLAIWVLPALGYARLTGQVAFVLLLSLLLESWGLVANAILDKALLFNQSSWLEAVVFPLSYIPAFWLAQRGSGVWCLIAQSATYNLLACAGKWWLGQQYLRKIIKHPLHFDRQIAKYFLKFGLSVGLIAFIGILSQRIDSWMIGTFLTETDLGYYDRAFRMFLWPMMMFNTLIQRIVFITYARLYRDKQRFIKITEQVTWLLLLGAVPVALILLLTSENLIALVYSEKWMESVPYLQIMSFASIARVLWANANALYTAMGKPEAMVKWGIAQLAGMLVLGIPLTLLLGARGTAIALTIAMNITCIAVYVDLARQQHQHLARVIIPLLIYGFIVGVGYFPWHSWVSWEFGSLLQLMIDVGYIGVAWLALLMLFNGKLVIHRLRSLWLVLTQKAV